MATSKKSKGGKAIKLAAPVTPPPSPWLPLTGRLQVCLDDLMSGQVRERLAARPEEDPRDIVNAAVDFLLSDPHEDGTPQDSSTALRWARERRLETERDNSPEAAALKGSLSPDISLSVDVRPPHEETTFVALDHQVTALLRGYVATAPGDDPRDVANGFLAAMLEGMLFDKGKNGGEAMAEARERRLARESAVRAEWADLRAGAGEEGA